MSSTRARLAGAVLLLALALPAAAAPPLSASDWLSGGAAPPPPPSAWRPGDPVPRDALRRPQRSPLADAPPVAESAGVEPVGVTRLDGPDADRVGLRPAARAGLPADLWAGVEAREAAALIAAADPRLPATAQLLRRILLAQLDPPARGEGEEGTLFLARIDKLLAVGEVGAAMALLDAAGPGDAERFRRRFDAALLLGRADSACGELTASPAGADMAARVFCLARAGDWAAAALSLRGAAGMGLIEPGLAARLGAFLDDAQVDAAEGVPLPEAVTPLDLRLLEAIGQPLPTTTLPLPFAVTDLGEGNGWKARLEAAERLARAGSLSPQRLRAIYVEQPPAASGGVWDRAAGVQRLDAALAADDRDAAAAALAPTVAAMAAAGLVPALGAMLGGPLAAMDLGAEAGTLAFRLALVGAEAGGPQALPALPTPSTPEDAWLRDMARGEPVGPAGAPEGALEGPVAAAVMGEPAEPPPGPKGPLLLAAMAAADAGLDGDAARAAKGIAALRALGQEGTARAAALQLILLPRLNAGRAG